MANETILIVDADTKSQKVLEVSFKKAGYRVMMTDSPRRAEAIVAEAVPDIIISDTRFPAGDGFELLTNLKQDGSDVPFIFLTEERSLPKKMKGFELGADDYLTKPVYIKEVTTRVDLLLQKRAKELLSEQEIEEVEGNLADITMIDLLQTIEEELRSGTIHFSREGRDAILYFREGNILDAICGKLQGEEAIYRLMLWPDGEFVLRYHDHVRRVDRIAKDSGALLLEGIRRLELWTELTDALPPLSTVFDAPHERVSRVMDELPVEVARIVRLFDSIRTLRDVVDSSPVDDVTTLRIVQRLIEDDLLEDVSPPQDQRAPRERSNLAAWLEGTRAGTHAPSEPSEPAELGREKTSLAYGNTSRAPVEDSLPESVPADEPSAPKAEAGEGAREDGAWKIHFEAADEEEAIRAIEAEERRRREEEARRLAGEARRDSTLQFAVAVERGLSEDSTTRQLEEEERRRREEEARQLQAQRMSDAALESTPNLPGARETGEERRPSETDLEQIRAEAAEADTADLERDGGEQRRRDRTPTPISTPAHHASLDQSLDQGSHLDSPDSFEIDEDEATTADIPEEEHAHAKHDLETIDVSEHWPERPAQESRPSPASGTERRAVSLDEAESVKREAAASVRESAHQAAARARDAAETETETAQELGTEISDFDAFEDNQSEPQASASDVSEPVDPSEVPASERETANLRAPTKLTPLGVDLAEPELTPEHVAPGAIGQLSEEANARAVERQARDREIVKAQYDLSSRHTEAPGEVTDAERETLDLEEERRSDSAAKDPEHAFFNSPLPETQYEYFEEPAPTRSPRWVLPALAGIAMVVVVLGLIIANQSGDTDSTDEVAAADEATPTVQGTAVAEAKQPPPETVGLAAEGARTVAFNQAGAVHIASQDLTLVLSGADVFGTPDAGAAQAESDEAAVEDAQPVAAAEPPAAEPAKKEEKTDEPRLAASSKEKEDEPAKEEPAASSAQSLSQKIDEAEKLLRRDRNSQALSLLRELSKEAPQNGKVAYLHGRAALNSSRNSEAIKELSRAERLGYKPAALYLELAAAYQLDGQRARAKQSYEKFLQLQPKGRQADEVRTILSTQF